MQFASFEKLKSVFASFGPGLFEEFRNWICFLPSIAKDDKDKHGLKPKKIGPTFSSFHAQKYFGYSPPWWGWFDIFFITQKEHFLYGLRH